MEGQLEGQSNKYLCIRKSKGRKNMLNIILGRLGLATINLCTKFEISTFIHYKDMKGDKNAKIGVVW